MDHLRGQVVSMTAMDEDSGGGVVIRLANGGEFEKGRPLYSGEFELEISGFDENGRGRSKPRIELGDEIIVRRVESSD